MLYAFCAIARRLNFGSAIIISHAHIFSCHGLHSYWVKQSTCILNITSDDIHRSVVVCTYSA